MLDLFCYSGGFSLGAARAGAASCVGVDSSAGAVELATRNAALNGLEATCSFTKADVMAFLQEAPPKSQDVVICDPPKYAPTIKDRTLTLTPTRTRTPTPTPIPTPTLTLP